MSLETKGTPTFSTRVEKHPFLLSDAYRQTLKRVTISTIMGVHQILGEAEDKAIGELLLLVDTYTRVHEVSLDAHVRTACATLKSFTGEERIRTVENTVHHQALKDALLHMQSFCKKHKLLAE
jgi:hypothetical protein